VCEEFGWQLVMLFVCLARQRRNGRRRAFPR
jgi:hypothetical protein